MTARVLLVEDDELARTVVRFAVEGSGAKLTVCSRVADALAHLAEAPVDLLITDLMLSGESGLDLLRQLPAVARPQPDLRVAVFSAGLTPAVRESLAKLGVWRMLTKPASVAELRACLGMRPQLQSQLRQR